jgi:hypothetical protein
MHQHFIQTYLLPPDNQMTNNKWEYFEREEDGER